MADEKTEQPTDKRLRDSREKGEVPKSQEIPSVAIVIVITAYFIAMSDSIFETLSAFVADTMHYATSLSFDEAWPLLSGYAVSVMLKICGPVVALVIVTSLLSNLVQVGVLIAPKGAAPKLSNLNPQKWFKQVFSKKNLFDFIKNIAKVVILTVAVFKAIQNNFRELFLIPSSDIGGMWTLMGAILRDLGLYSVGAFAAIAVIDLLYTRFKFTKDHMMSPDEVKREYKESEGDPQIKSKRKQLHQEMANQNTLGKTRKAKVLIVNPTHFAVAIDYDQEKTPLPKILAKGQGDLAKRMIEVAKQEGIPVMRQPPLARALFAQGVEGEFIPNDLLAPVAEILRYVLAISKK